MRSSDLNGTQGANFNGRLAPVASHVQPKTRPGPRKTWTSIRAEWRLRRHRQAPPRRTVSSRIWCVPMLRAIRSHGSGLSWFRMSFVRVLSQNAIANWFETGPGNEVQGAGEASKSTFKRTVSMSASQNPARLRPSAGRTRAQCLGLRTRPRRRVELPPMLKAERISGNQPPRRSCPAAGGG